MISRWNTCWQQDNWTLSRRNPSTVKMCNDSLDNCFVREISNKKDGLYAKLSNSADFRRIYGVVFHALLHGEATKYLLIVGTTILHTHKSRCGQTFTVACLNTAIASKQTKYNDGAKAQCQEFCYTLLG